jgi:hypothetical protein
MSSPPEASVTGAQILEREYLEVRAKLLELAAFFDRLDRVGGVTNTDPHLEKLRRGMELIGQESANRVEQILLHFSRPYEADWRDRFPLARRD